MMRRLRRGLLPLVVGWLAAVAYWIGVGPEEAHDSRADTAIVLGAAVADGAPSPVFRERIAHAIALHRQGHVRTLLFTGGRGAGDALAESEAGRAMALAAGVPAEAIVIETRSHTTLGNLTEARRQMASHGFANALIVSDPLHLRRALVMAESLGLDALPSATVTTRYRSWTTQAPFLLREVYFMHHFWLFGA